MHRLVAVVASILLLTFAAGSHPATAMGKRVALVIGNSDYEHTADLANPRNDATDLAAVLRDLGFQVISGFDLDRAAMLRTIRKFAEALSGADVGALFYAGHGLQVSGRNYLVPTDARLLDAAGLDFELVALELIQRTMEREASSNIIFLDACRDNPLARNLSRSLGGARSGSVGRGLAAVDSGVGTLISFSTQPGNVAVDGTGRNSPYANALVRELSRPGQDIASVLINVRRNVMAETSNQQVPWEHSALTDRFYFSPPQAGQPAASVGRSQDREDTEMRRALDELRRAREALEAVRRDKETAESESPADRMASLPPAPSSEIAATDKSDLVRRLQRELERVGCRPGDIDGIWGPKAQSALKNFARHARLALNTDQPNEDALKALTTQKKLVCPLECAADEVFDAQGNCVSAPSAPAGRGPGSRSGPAAGTCMQGNMAHCRVRCRQGVQFACQRLQGGSRTGGPPPGSGRAGRRGCRDGNMEVCRIRCAQGLQRACRRLRRGY